MQRFFRQVVYGTDEPDRTSVQKSADISLERLELEIVRANTSAQLNIRSRTKLVDTLKKLQKQKKALERVGRRTEAASVHNQCLRLVQKLNRVDVQIAQQQNIVTRLDRQLEATRALSATNDTAQAIESVNKLNKRALDEIDIDEITRTMDDVEIYALEADNISSRLGAPLAEGTMTDADAEALLAEYDEIDMEQEPGTEDAFVDIHLDDDERFPPAPHATAQSSPTPARLEPALS